MTTDVHVEPSRANAKNDTEALAEELLQMPENLVTGHAKKFRNQKRPGFTPTGGCKTADRL
jgi:hypothetical protein